MGSNISNLHRDGETRQFAGHGEVAITSAGGVMVMRGVFEPGFRWSRDIAPIAGTSSCQLRHLGHAISGRMEFQMDDGTEMIVGPGDVFDIPGGHDAWVIGDEPAVMFDYSPEAVRFGSRRAANLGPSDDKYMQLVRRGYEAFNAGDLDTLRTILSHDVVQHAPGTSQVAGTYKGIDAVLAYYGKLAELTEGEFRADLINVFGDGQGHVTSVHQMSASRNGVTRVSRGAILFTFLGERATDLLEMHEDLPGDDAFFA